MIHCLLGTVAYFANPKNIIDCKHPIIEARRVLFGKLECKLMCVMDVKMIFAFGFLLPHSLGVGVI